MQDDGSLISRRKALKCMAYGGAGTLFVLSGGVFTPIDLAMSAMLGVTSVSVVRHPKSLALSDRTLAA
jgi:hypothetical protein